MKYEIQLDKNNYVSGIVHNGDERDIYDDEFIYNAFYKDGHRVNCYHLVDDEFVLDEIKEQEEIAKEQKEQEIIRLKQELADTDYEAIKYSEGWFTDDEYAPIKAKRESLREQIRKLESDTAQ